MKIASMESRAAGGASRVHAHEGFTCTPHMLDRPAINVVDASELSGRHREHYRFDLVWVQTCVLSSASAVMAATAFS
jgi:hypothetical protein